IGEIVPAAERLAGILSAAAALLPDEPQVVEIIESSSPVCYAGEISNAYMGQLSPDELARELWQLAAQLHAALRTALAQHIDPAAPCQPPFADAAAELAGWMLA